jgi:ABC-type antimicrobial peptide transport system permease subunit
VGAADPLVYAALSVILLLVAEGASWFPARRATRIDPVIALRAE